MSKLYSDELDLERVGIDLSTALDSRKINYKSISDKKETEEKEKVEKNEQEDDLLSDFEQLIIKNRKEIV